MILGVVIVVAICGQGPPPGEVAPSALLAADRVKLARQAFSVMERREKLDVPEGSDVYILWSVRLMQAERDAGPDKAGRIAAVQAHLNRVKDVEAKSARLYRGGETDIMHYLDVQWKRKEAEAMLAEEKAGR